jgi:hypothetical protein
MAQTLRVLTHSNKCTLLPTACFVAVDEGITPLASASEPDMPLSRHPAPQSPDLLARTPPLLKSLERPPFTALTHVSSHPLGSLRRLRASPPLLATRSFRRPSPRQLIWGITPSLGFLGNPSRLVIRLAPALTSQQRGLLRSSCSFCASVESSYPPGFAGVNLGHSTRCPAPSLVPFGPSQYSSARWSFVTTVPPEVRCLPIDACSQG